LAQPAASDGPGFGALIALGRHLESGWFALLVSLAVGLLAVTEYCAYRTEFFNQLDAASSEIKHLSRSVVAGARASIVKAGWGRSSSVPGAGSSDCVVQALRRSIDEISSARDSGTNLER
jgi:hypothetical protein